MTFSNSSLTGQNAAESTKRYRTMLDPVAQYVFSRTEQPGPLLSFINAVLADSNEEPIKKITIQNPFNPKTYLIEKPITFDTLAEDENQREFIVEFQILDHRNFNERCLYYWARSFDRQLKQGELYGKLRPVIGIFLTDFQNPIKFGISGNTQQYPIHQSFSIRSDQNPENVLTDYLKLHFIQLPKEINYAALEGLTPALAAWVAYFGYPLKTTEEFMAAIAGSNPPISLALDLYNDYHRNPELRMIAEGHERFVRDALSYAETARAEGEAKGRAEGEAKGRAEGEAEGRAEGLTAVAVNLLNAGQKTDFISSVTGLSAEEIEKIAAENR